MSQTIPPPERRAVDDVPAELLALRERIRALPASVRADLEPLAEEAIEQARFRGRVLGIARDALEQFRLDLTVARFDLDVTRREREALRGHLAD